MIPLQDTALPLLGRKTARWRSPGVAMRGLGLYLLWVVLIGTGPLNLAVGVPAALLACWVSLLLVPAGPGHVSPMALARLLARLPMQSLVAGLDVARRALDPRLPLQPGFVRHATGLPPGPARDGFRALMSLQPGALPVNVEAEGDILVHCLDTAQPILAQMAAEEAFFVKALGLQDLGGKTGHG